MGEVTTPMPTGESGVGGCDVQPTTVVAEAVLLLGVESFAVETVAVLTICVPEARSPLTVYVVVTYALRPADRFETVHGKAEHAPVTETSVRPDGVGSVSVMFAGAGPLLRTMIE